MDAEFRQKVRNIYRVNRILWYAIAAGVLTLLIVGYFLHASGHHLFNCGHDIALYYFSHEKELS